MWPSGHREPSNLIPILINVFSFFFLFFLSPMNNNFLTLSPYMNLCCFNRKNVEYVVDYLFSDMKYKLLFCWVSFEVFFDFSTYCLRCRLGNLFYMNFAHTSKSKILASISFPK